MEILGKGEAVPYERCVRASTGSDPQPSNPSAKRKRVLELLRRAGYLHCRKHGIVMPPWTRGAASASLPRNSIPALSSAFVAEFDRLAQKNLLPYLPKPLHAVPRSNIRFFPITGSWFSGSMNYLGRARKDDGSPEYEANYEINARCRFPCPNLSSL